MNERKQEQCVELDPELDGEPLSDSDYEGCFQSVFVRFTFG